MKVLKYYTASWCGPCKTFRPLMESLQFEGLNISIIDIDKRQNEAIDRNISSVPTCIIEKNGKIVDRWSGVTPKQEVKRRYREA